MNRTHKLARGDHDGLSLRVAQQMQNAINPAGAMKSPILVGAGSATSAQPMTGQTGDRPGARG